MTTSTLNMESNDTQLIHYHHVIKDSQFITDLNMLLTYLKTRKVMNEEDIRYTIISIENTIKNGYKLVKENEQILNIKI